MSLATKYGNAGPLRMADELTLREIETLQECEERIERGLKTFLDVGAALLTIRESRLYRGAYATFDAYCAARWSMTGRRANQLASATQVVDLIAGTKVPEAPPLSERAARELSPLLDQPDELRAVFAEASEAAGGAPTAAQVREVVERRSPKPDPEPGSVRPASPAIVWVRQEVGDPVEAEVWLDDPGRSTVKVVYLASRTGAWIARSRIVVPVEATPDPAGPAAADGLVPIGHGHLPTGQVWMAAARRGLEFHELRTQGQTVCGRSTRTGLTMSRAIAEGTGGVPCRQACFAGVPADTASPEQAAGVVPDPVGEATVRLLTVAAGAVDFTVRPVDGPSAAAVVLRVTDRGRQIGDAWRESEDNESPVQVDAELSEEQLTALIDQLTAMRAQVRRSRGDR